MGACDIAPMASIDERYYGPLDEDDADDAVEQLRAARRSCPRSGSRTVAPRAGREGPATSGSRDTRSTRGRGATEVRGRADAAAEGRGDPPAVPEHRRAGAGLDQDLPEVRRLPVDPQGLQGDDPRGGPQGARGLRPAGPRRSRLFDGQEGLLPAPRRHGQVPLLQRRRVRAGGLQGPRADAEEPAPADRGAHHRRPRRRGEPLLHLHPGRVRPAGRHPRAGGRGGLRGRLARRERAGHRRAGGARRPPRRRRLHLRRGDGSPRLARGQARQPAAEAAVPGRPGALRRAHPDQQRRDPLQRAAHHRLGRRVVPQLRHRAVPRNQGRLGLRRRAAARQLRDRARHRDQAADQRAGRRPAAGSQDQGHLPRRLLLARADSGRGTRPTLQLGGDGRRGLDARLGLDHRLRRDHERRRARAADRALLPPRVLRQVHALSRGHQLDREDARADDPRRGDPDRPRDRRLRAGQHHRQLPLRARRLDGDAGRRDGQEVPVRVRRRDSARPAQGCHAAGALTRHRDRTPKRRRCRFR